MNRDLPARAMADRKHSRTLSGTSKTKDEPAVRGARGWEVCVCVEVLSSRDGWLQVEEGEEEGGRGWGVAMQYTVTIDIIYACAYHRSRSASYSIYARTNLCCW